ncbi:MAG: hypothetical protein ABI656_10925 [bacterium]
MTSVDKVGLAASSRNPTCAATNVGLRYANLTTQNPLQYLFSFFEAFVLFVDGIFCA